MLAPWWVPFGPRPCGFRSWTCCAAASAHGAHHTVGAARDLGAAHLAPASARKPLISAGLQGFLARSRGNGASAGYRCGTTRRPMNRRLVRSVRRATPVSPAAHRVNRSATGRCSTTSGAGSRPARACNQLACTPPTAGSSPALTPTLNLKIARG